MSKVLVRFFTTCSFCSLAIWTAASAADSSAACAGQSPGANALPGSEPVTICIQNTSSAATTTDKIQSEPLLAAEHYGEIILTALGQTLSNIEVIKNPTATPGSDAGFNPLFSEMSFGDFDPLQPLFDDFDNTQFLIEDGASWK